MARKRPSDALVAMTKSSKAKPPIRLTPSDANSATTPKSSTSSSASADDLAAIVSTLERKFQKKNAQQQRQLEHRLKDSMAQALSSLQQQARDYEDQVLRTELIRVSEDRERQPAQFTDQFDHLKEAVTSSLTLIEHMDAEYVQKFTSFFQLMDQHRNGAISERSGEMSE